jgi:hypothetical protein
MRGILLSFIQMADLEINLDFLIRDCLKAYTEETLEFEIPSTAQLAKGQYEELPGPFIFPEQILSFNSIEELSPLSPAEASDGFLALKDRFTCRVCSKPYSGNRELNRHMKKHSSPDKFSCTVDGCLHTSHRIDAMRCHIKKHEKRLKTQEFKIKKVTQKKD